MAYDPKNGGNLFPTTGSPAATVGINGDYALDTTTPGGPYIYGPKASGTWAAAMGLGGSAGTPGNLYNVIAKSANYTTVANDLTGGTPLFLVDASGGSVTFTIDASVLFTANKGVVVKRVDTTPANTVTLAVASGQTIDGGSTNVELSKASRTLVASSATAVQII